VLTIRSFYASDATENYFGMLCTDASRAVRLRFIEMIGEWATTMEDRWDHHERLVPFLLTGLTDDDEDIRSLAIAYIDRCGEEYASEHKDDFLEKRQLGIDGDELSNHDAPLPAPFARSGRPPLASRMWIREKGRRLYGPVLRELSDWISTTKSQSCKLLVVLLIYLEEAITMDLHKLFRALSQRLKDHEVRETVKIASSLIGRYVAPSASLPLVLPLGRGDAVTAALTAAGPSAAQSTQTRADALVLLTQLLCGSKPSTMLPHLSSVVEVVCAKTLLYDACEHDPTSLASLRLRRSLARAVEALANVVGARRSAAIDAYFHSKGRIIDVTAPVRALYAAALIVLPDPLTTTYLDDLSMPEHRENSPISLVSLTEREAIRQKLRPKLVYMTDIIAASSSAVTSLAAGESEEREVQKKPWNCLSHLSCAELRSRHST
jgi:hypothetical protein